jgi:hypothetical protein
MQLRAISVFTVSMICPMVACASEGLFLVAIYDCYADDVNREMAQTCVAKYPGLSTSAAEALAKWRARNAVKAQHKKGACEAELREVEKTMVASEIADVREQVAKARREIREGLLVSLRNEGQAACVSALHQVATGDGAIDLR